VVYHASMGQHHPEIGMLISVLPKWRPLFYSMSLEQRTSAVVRSLSLALQVVHQTQCTFGGLRLDTSVLMPVMLKLDAQCRHVPLATYSTCPSDNVPRRWCEPPVSALKACSGPPKP